MYVADHATLADVVQRLRDELSRDPRLGIDTEFIRERTYAPVLEVVQVATAGGEFVAVIDVPALGGDLGPLGDLLLDPSVLKILHSGAQDMEILKASLGAPPAPVFDTQVAAAFLGWGTQVGYGALVLGLLNVSLSKGESFADWSRRPLTPAMLAYAEDDVRYLHALHDRLSRRLNERGRAAWAEEQTRRVLEGAAAETAPEDLWRRVGGRSGMDGRGLAVLRELAIWRDEAARRNDKPRRTIMKDEVLTEVARRMPQTEDALLALRGVPSGMSRSTAGALVECVRRGLDLPKDQRPRSEGAPPLDERGAALVELLSAVVRARAQEHDLPPSLLATQDDLRSLAARRRHIDFDGPLFTGWRGAIVGTSLRDALAGRLALTWDPENERLALGPR